jgi:hypothetical protein
MVAGNGFLFISLRNKQISHPPEIHSDHIPQAYVPSVQKWLAALTEVSVTKWIEVAIYPKISEQDKKDIDSILKESEYCHVIATIDGYLFICDRDKKHVCIDLLTVNCGLHPVFDTFRFNRVYKGPSQTAYLMVCVGPDGNCVLKPQTEELSLASLKDLPVLRFHPYSSQQRFMRQYVSADVWSRLP